MASARRKGACAGASDLVRGPRVYLSWHPEDDQGSAPGLYLDWSLLGCVTSGRLRGLSEPWCLCTMKMVRIHSQLMGLRWYWGKQLVEAGSSLEEQLHWIGCRCAWLYLQKGMAETWLGNPSPDPGPTSIQNRYLAALQLTTGDRGQSQPER